MQRNCRIRCNSTRLFLGCQTCETKIKGDLAEKGIGPEKSIESEYRWDFGTNMSREVEKASGVR